MFSVFNIKTRKKIYKNHPLKKHIEHKVKFHMLVFLFSQSTPAFSEPSEPIFLTG